MEEGFRRNGLLVTYCKKKINKKKIIKSSLACCNLPQKGSDYGKTIINTSDFETFNGNLARKRSKYFSGRLKITEEKVNCDVASLGE